MSLVELETTVVELSHAAGEKALEAFRGTIALEFKGKKRDSPVTVLDRDTETFLRAELKRRFPSHGLLGEEHADDIAAEAERVWVIDPIDGTSNFASGLPLWGISIGLLERGVPVVGCIWVPVGPTLAPGAYHARAGGGAWFEQQSVSVSKAVDERGQLMTLPGDFLRAFRVRRAGRGVGREQRALPDARTLGSCTAELVLIASGALRAGVFVKPSIWDVAAGALIVREAGGHVLTWRERRWQHFERFQAVPPERGEGPPALRNWGQPMVMGAPQALQRLLPRLAWHPRLPKRLQRLTEGEAVDKLRQGGLPL
ncbi:MAG TPA: inositol monophosphatase [Chloroflexota bacterium]|nr:inositol monophosphatase [Chloroflexota bacterium]